MNLHASVLRKSVPCLMIGLAAMTVNHAFGQDKAIPSSGSITFTRLCSPVQPDRVEKVNLASGEIEQVVQASPERPSIRSFSSSPGRRQCLFEMGSGENWHQNNEIYLRNTEENSVRRVTENAIYDGDPAWSPDGTRFAFTRGWGVDGRVRLRELASGGERALSTPGLIITREPHWLTEGTLLVHGVDTEDRHGLAEVRIESGSVRWLVKDQVDYLCLSPDRKRLACVVRMGSVAKTQREPEWVDSVNILTLAAATLKSLDHRQTSFEQDVCPVWSHDGKKLAWIRSDRQKKTCKLVIHDVATEGTTSIPIPDEESANAGSLLWAPDDNRLACVSRDQHGTEHNLRLIVLSTSTIRDILSIADQIQFHDWE